MVYLFPSGDTFTIVYDASILSDEQLSKAIKVDALPEGEGILKMDEQGQLYYEPYQEEIEPPVEPEIEPPVHESLEDKIARLETITEQNNLITVDAVLGVYEEVIALREEVAALKGITSNA